MSEQHRDSRTIERELAATRSRLDTSIDALQQKISPRQVADQAMSFFKDGDGGQFGRNLVNQVRDQPLAVALVGAGLAWLAAGGRSSPQPRRDDRADHAWRASSSLSRRQDETEEAFRERSTDAQGTALGIKRSVGEAGSAFAGRVEQAMHGTADYGRAAGSAVRDGLHSTGTGVRDATQGAWAAMQENPVLAAAIGVTAGAALAALLPASRYEEENLGPAIDRAAEQLRETVEPMVDRAKDVAGRAADAAVDTARQEMPEQTRPGATAEPRPAAS